MHEKASKGFAAAAVHYEAYRPSYPAVVVEFIRRTARLDEHSVVVDLAAGTGLMTRLLTPAGRLIAVEPVGQMRDILRERVAEAEILDGTAEHIPLASAVADALVVAQAFHWFANPEAVREIARVLKPEGSLFLVWNVKNEADPLMRELDIILEPYRSTSPGYSNVPWRELFGSDGLPLQIVSSENFAFDEPLTLRQLKGRLLSTSYIALLDEDRQGQVLLSLEKLVGSADDVAPVLMRYRTEVFVGRHRGYDATSPAGADQGDDARLGQKVRDQGDR